MDQAKQLQVEEAENMRDSVHVQEGMNADSRQDIAVVRDIQASRRLVGCC